MTKEFYRTGRVNREYLDCYGLIYDYDYNKHLTMGDMASRIANDIKFEEKCKRETKFRDNNMKYKTELMRGGER